MTNTELFFNGLASRIRKVEEELAPLLKEKEILCSIYKSAIATLVEEDSKNEIGFTVGCPDFCDSISMVKGVESEKKV